MKRPSGSGSLSNWRRSAPIAALLTLMLSGIPTGPSIYDSAADSYTCVDFPLSTGLRTVGVSASIVAVTGGEHCEFVAVTTAEGQVNLNQYPPPGNLRAPIVGMATANTGGYWLAGADGGVFAFGGAGFFGSAANLHLNAPIVGIASTPDNQGYYLVSADGGVFAFGDAVYQGSMSGKALNASIVAIADDPLTGGYRLVAADGGVFDFGAPFLGSMAGTAPVRPFVGIATDLTTGGYWLASTDGGVFAFGSPFYGSWVTDTSGPIVGIASAPGEQYWIVDQSGNLANCSATALGGITPTPGCSS